MTNRTAPRMFPAHALKGGDVIANREVFDTRDTFGLKVAILFTDGTRLEVDGWDVMLEVTN